MEIKALFDKNCGLSAETDFDVVMERLKNLKNISQVRGEGSGTSAVNIHMTPQVLRDYLVSWKKRVETRNQTLDNLRRDYNRDNHNRDKDELLKRKNEALKKVLDHCETQIR